MRSTASRLRARKQELSELMTREMGKLIHSAHAEIEKCAWVCEYFAENTERFLADEPVETDASRSYVTFNPIGVVLAVMPWNFPFWQVFRFIAPALMAGNAGLLKHASNVPGCAVAIEDVLRDAGAPEDLFRTLLVSGRRVPELIADPRIAAVTLTGSTEAGRSVGSAAGREIKKSVLELGGSDAYVVLGGTIPPGAGAFYPPTVLTNVVPGNPAFDEELFGPVAAIVRARDEAHAIELANDSVFGLGAAVFTRDAERGERIAATELEAGHCAVNSFVKSDPRLPFGGVKASGYGRELSWYGIKEFVNIKTVYIA